MLDSALRVGVIVLTLTADGMQQIITVSAKDIEVLCQQVQNHVILSTQVQDTHGIQALAL